MKRNNIHVKGLSDKKEISDINFSHIQHFYEKDYISLEVGEESIISLDEAEINLSLSSHRLIEIGKDTLLLLEGEKKITLAYITDSNHMIKTSYLLPFNSMIKLDKANFNPDTIKVFLIDLYPYLVNERNVYCRLLYTIGFDYSLLKPQTSHPLKRFNPIILSDNCDPDEESL